MTLVSSRARVARALAWVLFGLALGAGPATAATSDPAALADPVVTFEARVAVGPDGLAHPGDPYYLEIVLRDPEPPTEANASGHDCAAEDRPATLDESVARVVAPLLVPPDGVPNSVAPWFPTCVAVALAPVACPAVCAASASTDPYASYDVPAGRYYAEAGGGSGVTGTTGAGARADCELCPPAVE